jgi:hypothetical protein
MAGGWPGVDAVQVAVQIAVGDHDEDPSDADGLTDEPGSSDPGLRVRLKLHEVRIVQHFLRPGRLEIESTGVPLAARPDVDADIIPVDRLGDDASVLRGSTTGAGVDRRYRHGETRSTIDRKPPRVVRTS